MGVSSEQSGDNMNRSVVALAFVGCAFGAPSILPAVGHAYTAGSAVVGHGPAVATSGAYAAGPAVVGQTHHATYNVHSAKAVVTSHATPVHETVHVPVHTEQTHVVPGVAHVPTVASYATNAVVGHAAIPAAHGVIGAAHGIVGAAHGLVGAAGVIAH